MKIEEILDELTEISVTPMQPEKSEPTSLDLLKSLGPDEMFSLNLRKSSENENEPESLTRLVVELLDRSWFKLW